MWSAMDVGGHTLAQQLAAVVGRKSMAWKRSHRGL
jgi:hypothetical protein